MINFTTQAIVIGVSAGGLKALEAILTPLPVSFPVPILIVQHMAPGIDNYLAEYLDSISKIHIKEACDKDIISPGVVYIAPGGYHLLIEEDKTLSLCVSEKVNYCRPSVDVLFESASEVYGKELLGIVLTGANKDGTLGAKMIRENGGTVLVQSPETAEAKLMPLSVIEAGYADMVLSLPEIASFLLNEVTSHAAR